MGALIVPLESKQKDPISENPENLTLRCSGPDGFGENARIICALDSKLKKRNA